MKADQIFEDTKQIICIYPGRFQPPHRGHATTFRQLEKKYGAANTFIATSNKTDGEKSPFNFAEKKELLIATGIPSDQIFQVVNTYNATEITSRFDLSKTIVVYAVGEKDMGEDPRFSSFTKKDGSPSYLQKMTDNPETADKHAYLIVAPTVQFKVNGKNITSASEIRQMYRQADEAERADIIHQLYGMNTKTATRIFNAKLLPQENPTESIEENFKDGKGPGRPGDAKRHGVPTKASVSTLRKVAKQGGRKGQLAHWMANMKSGKKKAAKEGYGATNPTSQLTDRNVAVMPFDRWAVKVDENYEPNLFEVSMSPGALNDFAKSEIAQTMTIGFEMELAMPDLPEEGNGGSSEIEDDMEMNIPFPEGRRWRQDAIDWLTSGDNANGDRDAERAMEFLDEEFLEYSDEYFSDLMSNDEDLQQQIKNEIHDILALQDKPSDADAIAAEYDEQTDIYTDAVVRVKDEWYANNSDDVFEDFKMRYRIRDMEDFINYINRRHPRPRVSLSWPYITYGSEGSDGDIEEYLQDIANELESKLQQVNGNFYVVVSEGYHDESREENKFIIEPDSSIDPTGREFISPAMKFADGMAAMEVMFKWAQGKRYKTNRSTGFHMGISLPNHETQNIDHMKFILMLGDQHVLEKFNRAKAYYALNTVNTMRDTLNRESVVNKDQVAQYLRKMATGMQDLATAELNKLLVPRGEHRQSVNIKNKYMEIRSAGDDYLPRFDDIRLTLLRYLRTLEISADSEAYRREYAKKLSKFLTNTDMIRTVDPITGRKSVASKESLDSVVQMAFSQYFAELQRGASGDEAIANLTKLLNQHRSEKTSQLKSTLRSKRNSNDPNSSKVRYKGASRVEFSATGDANDVINSIIDYTMDQGISGQRQNTMLLSPPDKQELWAVTFGYNGTRNGVVQRQERNYWCFAPDKAQAIAQAKKAWNINSDQYGDLWSAISPTSSQNSILNIIKYYQSTNRRPPDDRADASLSQVSAPTSGQNVYIITDADGSEVRGLIGTRQLADTPAQAMSQFLDRNGLPGSYAGHYAVFLDTNNVDLPDRDEVTGTAEYIVTYELPSGGRADTIIDASSASAAAEWFDNEFPANYEFVSARPVTQGGSTSNPAQAEQPEERPITYSLRGLDDRGIVTFTTTNDQSALDAANQFMSQHSQYTLYNTELFRYADDGVTRRPVRLLAGGQQQSGSTDSLNPPAAAPQSNAEGTPGTFIVTYLTPQGTQQRTAYNANSATEAATLFRTQHPPGYQLHEITRLQESVSESKKSKRPKTIIDGALKTLQNKGRSQDEAIADLKKEIDKKFYSEDSVTFDRMQPGETIAEALARARKRLVK